MANNGVKAGYWLTNSQLPASDINTKLFTHLFCGYAGINPDTYEVAITPLGETFSKDVKKSNPEVKALLSIGGDGATPECIAAMASSEGRNAFIKSSIYFAREYNYDGLDLHWLYPRSIFDMSNLRDLLLEWRKAIIEEANSDDQPQLLLVAGVFFLPYIDWPRYPVETIQETLDWVNLITYDFNTPTSLSDSTAPTSPFHNPKDDYHAANYGFLMWVKDLSPEKIVFGIPFHGWAWKLDDAKQNDLSSPAQGPAEGSGISTGGIIEYSNIKKFKMENKVYSTIKEEYPVACVYFGTTWIAYDNEYTIVLKIREVKEKFKFLGYFAWNIANDDEDNTLAKAAFRGWDGA